MISFKSIDGGITTKKRNIVIKGSVAYDYTNNHCCTAADQSKISTITVNKTKRKRNRKRKHAELTYQQQHQKDKNGERELMIEQDDTNVSPLKSHASTTKQYKLLSSINYRIDDNNILKCDYCSKTVRFEERTILCGQCKLNYICKKCIQCMIKQQIIDSSVCSKCRFSRQTIEK